MVSLRGNGPGDESALGRAALEVVDDRAVVVAGFKGDAQQIDKARVVLTQERAIAATSVHQFGWQFACELGTSLDDEARQPSDAIDFVRLGRDRVGIELRRGGFAAECVYKVVTPNLCDALDLVVLDVVPLDAVLD
ncbi:MAG: hypothetical protein MK293_14405 [Pedosphaera sp.]|nr:hypothetical protein [Pedosphaera sp.]